MRGAMRRAGGAVGLLLLLPLTACAEPAPRVAPTVALPSTFPRAVPVARGRVLDSSASNGEWRVRVATADVLAGYRSAKRALVSAGYSTTIDNEFPDSGQGQFCDARLCVGLDATTAAGRGGVLAYEVWPNTGLGPPA